MAHLTNFSFEFFYKIFTEDASHPFLYHGAKKSKMTKNSNQGGGGGSCLNTKHYWKWKRRLCVNLFEVMNTTWENLQTAKHKSVSFVPHIELICALRFPDWVSQVVFITSNNFTQNLFFHFLMSSPMIPHEFTHDSSWVHSWFLISSLMIPHE